MIELSVSLDMDALALQIAYHENSDDDVMDLILAIDAERADWDFTIKLHRALTKVLRSAELPNVPEEDDFETYVLNVDENGKAHLTQPSEGVLAFFDLINKK